MTAPKTSARERAIMRAAEIANKVDPGLRLGMKLWTAIENALLEYERAAVEREREACAKVADREAERVIARNDISEFRIAGMGQSIASAIRARREEG